MFDLIRNIKGPDFLVIYMVYSLAIIVLVKIIINMMGNTGRSVSGKNLDSYSISILKSKNSINVLAQTIVFKLYAEKYLEMDSSDNSMTFQKTSKPTDTLNRVEDGVVEHFDSPKSFYSLMADQKMGIEIKSYMQEINTRLIEAGLMKSKKQLSKENTIGSIGCILLVLLGVTKLTMGLINNKPVGFLVVEIIIMAIAFVIVNKSSYLTLEGKNYLKEKGAEYSWVTRNATRNSSFPSNINDAVMGAALFGIASMYIYSEFGALSRGIGMSTSYASDTSFISSSNIGDSNSGGCSSNSGCSSSSGCSGSSGCGGCGGCGGGD